MAGRNDMDFSYTTVDRFFRASIGEMGDFSGAWYDGDFSLTLEQAQRAKHERITRFLHIERGSRVLDMSCGWGPFLNFVREIGASGLGVTLSEGQAQSCRKNGLDVYNRDCRALTPDDFGLFDAVVSIGGFEHFVSIEDRQAGRQDDVYRAFFQTVHALLRPGGRFYMQTMVFGAHMIPFEQIDARAPKGSDAYLLAQLRIQFPGSCLPFGPDQVIDDAAPLFSLEFKSSGRLDYIETIAQWKKRYRTFTPRRIGLFASLVPAYLTSPNFRKLVGATRGSPNRVCFQRELLDHYRLVFRRN